MRKQNIFWKVDIGKSEIIAGLFAFRSRFGLPKSFQNWRKTSAETWLEKHENNMQNVSKMNAKIYTHP